MYSQLFARSFKWFKDFILFFFYLVLGLAFGVNALSKLSGGPLDLIYASGAVSGIMRLTFGFYDYDGEMFVTVCGVRGCLLRDMSQPDLTLYLTNPPPPT